MQVITRVVLACSTTLFLAGCAKSDQPPKDTTAASAMAAPPAAPAPAPAAPALALADVAGKWKFSSVPESGTDTTPTLYVLTATADTTGWVITFPSGVKSRLHVSASGDSIVARSDTFASQRRKGVKVMTESSWHLQNGKLAGTSIAHYVKAGADSVLRLRSEGTKSP